MGSESDKEMEEIVHGSSFKNKLLHGSFDNESLSDVGKNFETDESEIFITTGEKGPIINLSECLKDTDCEALGAEY